MPYEMRSLVLLALEALAVPAFPASGSAAYALLIELMKIWTDFRYSAQVAWRLSDSPIDSTETTNLRILGPKVESGSSQPLSVKYPA